MASFFGSSSSPCFSTRYAEPTGLASARSGPLSTSHFGCLEFACLDASFTSPSFCPILTHKPHYKSCSATRSSSFFVPTPTLMNPTTVVQFSLLINKISIRFSGVKSLPIFLTTSFRWMFYLQQSKTVWSASPGYRHYTHHLA